MMIEAVIYGPTPSEKIDICSIEPPPNMFIIPSIEFALNLIIVELIPGAGIAEPSL